MSDNLIDELISDSNYKAYSSTDYLSQSAPQDNDSASSFLNLIEQEILTNNQILGDNYSPNYTMSDSTNNTTNDLPAKPDVKSSGLEANFEELLLSKLPQIVAIERASTQYQVMDAANVSLSKSFQNCFNSPVLDLLVVVLDHNKLVSFYQGYFAGIPRLTNELINLDGKYWKSLISNNDDNAWENHYRSVNDKTNSKPNYEPEFEAGPVIRCRLRTSSSPQFNQQFNYFFVQPCSFMIQLAVNNFNTKSMEYNSMDNNNVGGVNNYFVSYINIVRECDTEYALKGSAAASLQKVITNSTYVQRQKLENTALEAQVNNKQTNNRNFRRNMPNSQLTVNISSPGYSNMEQSSISSNAPLTYPLINNQRTDPYNKTNIFPNSQMSHQMAQQRQSAMPITHGQYISRGASLSNVDPTHHRYNTHYDNAHPSSLQYILENRPNAYPNVKQMTNSNHLIGQQHGQIFKNQIPSNHAYFLQTAQSAQQNCSLNSPNSFMPSRHVIQMPSNSILMSTDQYFRNGGHQINLMDSVQIAQSMPSAPPNHSQQPTNYYYSTSQNPILHNPLHINTSLNNQSQFVSSSVSPYCSGERVPMTHQQPDYSNTASSRISSQTPIKQESYDINICQNDWLSNPVLDSRNSNLMSNNSIPIDIVEEILQAEEAKSDNKSLEQDISKSDSSDSLMGYLNDYMALTNNTTPTSAPNMPVSTHSPQLVNLKSVKTEGKVAEFKPTNAHGKSNNPPTAYSINKEEILKNLDSSQRLQIKKIVNQYKTGKITKQKMCHQIHVFLSQALGSRTYSQQVIRFWNQKHPLSDNVDSTLPGLNYSHVVQSPEEGPGISPTEQAAQSTTDLEEDKELNRFNQKSSTGKMKDKSETNRRPVRTKSNSKNLEASIYSISSTTSTGVLETLLNEHDNPLVSDKNYGTASTTNNIVNCKLPLSSAARNQLSLDQLLLDDDYPLYPVLEDKFSKKMSDNPAMNRHNSANNSNHHQHSTNINNKTNKSQPSTPIISNNMGVLETLLNQETPSMFTLRQMSTENILNHSKPSRQNSADMFMVESNNCFDSMDKDKDKGLKKNSLLINLLNNNQSLDKGKKINSTSSMDSPSPNFPSKKSRGFSGSQSSFDGNVPSKKTDDKLVSAGIDVFDFVDNEMGYCTTDTQSTVVTSSQPLSNRKRSQSKRTRKRRYSKDRSIDSDESSDRLSSIGEKYLKTSLVSAKPEDKNVILTSLLENKKPRDIMAHGSVGQVLMNIGKQEDDSCNQQQQSMIYANQTAVADDNIDLEDIKIDDFDLENLIDISDNYDESTAAALLDIVDESLNKSINHSVDDPAVLMSKSIMANSTTNTPTSTFDVVPPVYKMVGPVIKSDPIVPMSKQSIIRVSDKNSILLSAIQSTSTSNAISFECLDNERERLLRQQQQQKVCMGGDKPPVTMSHQLSLDMLSKQMKEVGPNVMVELNGPSDIPRSRKGSLSRSQSGMSVLTTSGNPSSVMSTSPTCRSTYPSNCAMEMGVESTKTAPTSVNQVNHQLVREGLRLLVSNRSAQNNSKNINNNNNNNGNMHMVHRNNTTNLDMAPQSLVDNSSTPKSTVKDVIHYPSSVHSTTSHKDPSYPYSNQSYSSNMTNPNECKTADILEDSLVNDVFGLEELVNSRCRQITATVEYSRLHLHQDTLADESHIDSMSFSSQHTMSAHNKPSHHHHHTHHYHHHHPHHHHHAVSSNPTSSSAAASVDNNIVNSATAKPSVNSGLLETLLSR